MGKEENFRAYPGRCWASGKIGERERGLRRGRREGSLCDLGSLGLERGKALPLWGMSCSVRNCVFMCLQTDLLVE